MRKYANMGERLIANSILSSESYFNGSPCWEWIGAISNSGYPTLSLRWKRGPRKGKVHRVYAHRESLKFFRGETVRKGYVVMHLCNNRRCVNPMHLSRGSQAENIQQCVADGRHFTPYRKTNEEQLEELGV